MSYLVMECHTSYAVVLDAQGRFLKVANLGYEIGDQLDQVVEFRAPTQSRAQRSKWIPILAAAAACLCFLLLGAFQFLFSPLGSVQLKINPHVRMTVNRLDYVLKLEGLNLDGEHLVEGVNTFGKKVDVLSDELADRAVEMGYLSSNGQIALVVESSDKKWQTTTEQRLLLELDVHLGGHVKIVSVPAEPESSPQSSPTSVQPVIIPVTPNNTVSSSDSSTSSTDSSPSAIYSGIEDDDGKDDDTGDLDGDDDSKDDDTGDSDDDDSENHF